jgi:hypothetical protein
MPIGKGGKKSTGHTAANTKILHCGCRHEYQDKKYGAQQRVHNPRAGGKFACTVCDNVKG